MRRRKFIMPSNAVDAKGLVKTAIRDNSPVMIFEHKKLYQINGEVPEKEYTIPFGKARIKCDGSDVTIIATSYMVKMALEAADILKQQGGSVPK